MGKCARVVLAFVAEMEREKILDRTTSGKINQAKEGKVVSGNKVLDWCRKIKSEREELTYTKKRDFLYMLGATVFIEKQAYVGLSQLGIYELPYQRCRKSFIRGKMVMHLQIFF